MVDKNDLQIIAFESSKSWEHWLAVNNGDSIGLWLRIFKKDSETTSVDYVQALDVALCYGWIDGQKKTYDKKSWLQKFTPRRPKSMWSKRNVANVTRLIKSKKMKPPGLKEVEAAKRDGRWRKSYAPPSTMVMPDDFMNELTKNKKAETFFKTLNKANTYAIGWRLQTAKKPETREKRLKMILEMLSKGKKFHD
jgi:uncharacterized protein YdeI (YjbR/CyaY-like superfamily)